MRFVAAPDCAEILQQYDIPDARVTILRAGEMRTFPDLTIRAVDADHGELAPEAVGLVIETEGLTFYTVGDSGFAPERILPHLPAIDVMIAPINGAYGNLNEEEACRLGAMIRPRWLIGCHTGMFAVHGGDPQRFLALARALEDVTALVMAPGECRVFSRGEVRP